MQERRRTETSFRLISERFSFRYPYREDVFSKSKFSVSELNRMIRGQQAVPAEEAPAGVPADTEGDEKPECGEKSGAPDRCSGETGYVTGGEEEAGIQLSIFDLAELPGYGGREDAAAALDEKIREIQLKEKKGDGEEEENVSAGAQRRNERSVTSDGLLSGESCEAAVPAFLRGEAPITAAMRGTITHRVMELIPFREDIGEKDVRDFASALVEKNILSRREAEAVPARDIARFFPDGDGQKGLPGRLAEEGVALYSEEKPGGAGSGGGRPGDRGKAAPRAAAAAPDPGDHRLLLRRRQRHRDHRL